MIWTRSVVAEQFCLIFTWLNVCFVWLSSGDDGTEVLFGTSDGRVGLVQIGRSATTRLELNSFCLVSHDLWGCCTFQMRLNYLTASRLMHVVDVLYKHTVKFHGCCNSRSECHALALGNHWLFFIVQNHLSKWTKIDQFLIYPKFLSLHLCIKMISIFS